MTTTTEDTLLDVTLLDGLAARLQSAGIVSTRTEEALCCELSIANKPYAMVYIVAAESLFLPGLDARAFRRHFESVQERIMGEAFYERPRKDLTMLVVGSPEFLALPETERNAIDVVHDTSYGKKEVLTVDDALAWFCNPFVQLAGATRANQVSTIATVAEPRGTEQPIANYKFDIQATLQASEEPRYLVKAAATTVYRRIMGYDRVVFWDDNIPTLGRVGDTDGLPVAFCSSGEGIVFAYALFLARAMMDVSPGMRIGIYGSFDRLDTVRQIGAYDCLRSFALATGADIVVQSAKKSLRDLVAHRLRAVIDACGGTVTDYPAA